jgi:hypothetical protein
VGLILRESVYRPLILPAVKLYKDSAPRGGRYFHEFTAGSISSVLTTVRIWYTSANTAIGGYHERSFSACCTPRLICSDSILEREASDSRWGGSVFPACRGKLEAKRGSFAPKEGCYREAAVGTVA